MDTTIPKLPTSLAAWVLTSLGLLSLACAMWASMPTIQYAIKYQELSRGLEPMLGLYIALPMCLLGALLFGICTFRQRLKSSIASWGFGFSMLGIASWIAVLVKLA